MAALTVSGGLWWLNMLLVIGGHESFDTASSPGLLEDPSPKRAQETLKLSERAKPLTMPISACDFDFVVWGFAAQTAAPSTECQNGHDVCPAVAGTTFYACENGCIERNAQSSSPVEKDHSSVLPQNGGAHGQTKAFSRRHHAIRVALGPPQSQQRLLQTSSPRSLRQPRPHTPASCSCFDRPTTHGHGRGAGSQCWLAKNAHDTAIVLYAPLLRQSYAARN
jgi:hypothetical protein